MNIQSVNSVNSTNYSNPNFNGLWKLGKVKQYYPFLDEKISKAVDNAKIMDRLPFTARQFSQYLRNRLNSITKERLIERFYKEKELSISCK